MPGTSAKIKTFYKVWLNGVSNSRGVMPASFKYNVKL